MNGSMWGLSLPSLAIRVSALGYSFSMVIRN